MIFAVAWFLMWAFGFIIIFTFIKDIWMEVNLVAMEVHPLFAFFCAIGPIIIWFVLAFVTFFYVVKRFD